MKIDGPCDGAQYVPAVRCGHQPDKIQAADSRPDGPDCKSELHLSPGSILDIKAAFDTALRRWALLVSICASECISTQRKAATVTL